jgi:hypothetical protein
VAQVEYAVPPAPRDVQDFAGPTDALNGRVLHKAKAGEQAQQTRSNVIPGGLCGNCSCCLPEHLMSTSRDTAVKTAVKFPTTTCNHKSVLNPLTHSVIELQALQAIAPSYLGLPSLIMVLGNQRFQTKIHISTITTRADTTWQNDCAPNPAAPTPGHLLACQD